MENKHKTIMDLSRLMLLLNRFFAEKHNINVHSVHILEISNNKKPIPIKTIKKQLGLSSASLSRMLSNLYKKKLIQRTFAEQGDKRQIYIKTTTKGKKILTEIQDKIENTITKLQINIDDDQTKTINQQLYTLITKLNQKEEQSI